jgi:hypothetical protein
MTSTFEQRLPRRLALDCDYGAEPVWGLSDDGTTYLVGVDPLPVSEDLKRDLRVWGARFLDIAYPPDRRSEIDKSVWDVFVGAGGELAERLQLELGPEVEVVYRLASKYREWTEPEI